MYVCVNVIFLLFSSNMCFREFSMLVEGNLVEYLFLAKCVTLLKYCVNKTNNNNNNKNKINIAE